MGNIKGVRDIVYGADQHADDSGYGQFCNELAYRHLRHDKKLFFLAVVGRQRNGVHIYMIAKKYFAPVPERVLAETDMLNYYIMDKNIGPAMRKTADACRFYCFFRITGLHHIYEQIS